MRLGAPVFVDSDDPDAIARAHRDLGYRAAYCPDLSLDDPDGIRAVREAFARHDVVIAEVGVWNNLMDPDESKRRANLKAMEEGLALADEVGALCVVNIAGGFNAEHWDGPHPDDLSPAAFDLAVENARRIVEAVRPKRAKLTYEMMPYMIPDGPDSYLELIQAVDRPAFGVHLDVVNIINSPRRYYGSADLVRECFGKLGPYTVSCHLKDIRLDDRLTVHLDEVMVGRGGFDLPTYLQEAAKLPHEPPVLLEHLRTPEEYEQARRYVLDLVRELGINT